MTMNVSMESHCAGRTIIDICQTTLKHKNITNDLIVYALTWCDTVLYIFDIGKATALNVLIGGHHLIKLGQHGADEDKLISEVTTFVAACYGSKVDGDMTTHRYQMLKSKMANSNTISALKVAVFIRYVHRA